MAAGGAASCATHSGAESASTTVELVNVGFPWGETDALPTLYRPGGCSTCSQTGYHGRMALHEVMTVTEEVERLSVERRSADEIGRTARSQGMTTLREDGLAKVALGRTTLEEVSRVIV